MTSRDMPNTTPTSERPAATRLVAPILAVLLLAAALWLTSTRAAPDVDSIAREPGPTNAAPVNVAKGEGASTVGASEPVAAPVVAPTATPSPRTDASLRHGALEVRCRKRTPAGEGLAGVAVAIAVPDGSLLEFGTTDAQGVLRAEGVPLGEHQLVLSHDAWLPIRPGRRGHRHRVHVPGPPLEIEWHAAFAFGVELRGGLVRLALPERAKWSDDIFGSVSYMLMNRALKQRLVPEPWDDHRSTHVVALLNSIPPVNDNGTRDIELTAFHPDLGPCTFRVPVVPADRLHRLTPLAPAGHAAVEAMCAVDVVPCTPSGRTVDLGRCELSRSGERFGFRGAFATGSERVWVVAGQYRLTSHDQRFEVHPSKLTLTPGQSARVEMRCAHELARVRLELIGADSRGCVLQIELPGGGYTSFRAVKSGDTAWLRWGSSRLVLSFPGPDGEGTSVTRTVLVHDHQPDDATVVLDLR